MSGGCVSAEQLSTFHYGIKWSWQLRTSAGSYLACRETQNVAFSWLEDCCCCSLLRILARNTDTSFNLINHSASKNSLDHNFPNGLYSDPTPQTGVKPMSANSMESFCLFPSLCARFLSLGEVAQSRGVSAWLLQGLRELGWWNAQSSSKDSVMVRSQGGFDWKDPLLGFSWAPVSLLTRKAAVSAAESSSLSFRQEIKVIILLFECVQQPQPGRGHNTRRMIRSDALLK